MTGVARITEALKRCLKARGMTYASLAVALELSEASVKRLFSSGSFTLKRVEQICRVLDLDFLEDAHRYLFVDDDGPRHFFSAQSICDEPFEKGANLFAM